MTSIENEIFSMLMSVLPSGTYIASTYEPAPVSFPCVFIEEADNFSGVVDGSGTERISSVMYEINVFSNALNGAKSECKSLMSTIDSSMVDAGFHRSIIEITPNEDPDIFRMTARYTANVSQNKTIYRR